MDFLKKLLALLSIVCLFALTLQAPCNKRRMSPKKALKRIRRRYSLVDIREPESQENTDNAKSVGRYCPFEFENEDSLESGITQIPKDVVKATCHDCNHYCHPVYYSIRVLQKKGCDKRTGDEIYVQVEKRIPVAYVFNP